MSRNTDDFRTELTNAEIARDVACLSDGSERVQKLKEDISALQAQLRKIEKERNQTAHRVTTLVEAYVKARHELDPKWAQYQFPGWVGVDLISFKIAGNTVVVQLGYGKTEPCRCSQCTGYEEDASPLVAHVSQTYARAGVRFSFPLAHLFSDEWIGELEKAQVKREQTETARLAKAEKAKLKMLRSQMTKATKNYETLLARTRQKKK